VNQRTDPERYHDKDNEQHKYKHVLGIPAYSTFQTGRFSYQTSILTVRGVVKHHIRVIFSMT
jgi:hypothetical protein